MIMIERALFDQELAALEALGQLFAHRLLDHARTGKADQCIGLGDVDIAEHREARRDAAHGRIRHHRDEGQAASRNRPRAALVLAICISENSDSCMRAPPLAEKQTWPGCP